MMHGKNEPALQQQTILEVTWTNCPSDVQEDVRELWADYEYGNDCYYHSWVPDPEITEKYPVLAKYLADNNVSSCLIHYWW